jgi:RNA polymerase sigma-70 factor (ECF subfamily)
MERVEQTGTISDRDLVARCQAGDDAAFDALVRQHQQRAVNVAYQLLRNREDAMEVAQDVFVKIYQNIGTFRGECEFTTWLHTIVVNLARNKHRWWMRRRRDATVSADCPIEAEDGPLQRQIVDPSSTPDVQVLNDEFARNLERTLALLPGKFREVLVLRNVEDLSYEEIAVVLKCSVGTVKSRIARAREAMRKAMAGELR